MDRADIKRTDNTLLPDSAELTKVLETEVDRPVPTNKIGVHYPEFTTVIDLFTHFGLDTGVFTDDSINIHQAVTIGRELLDKAVILMVETPPTQNSLRLFDAAYDYLAEEDDPKPSDIIFTFGAKTPLRAEKAVELYQEGLGRLVMASGGNPIYNSETDSQPEALRYRDIYIKGGVPEDTIILEDKAITVPDNVRRSLNLLDQLQVGFNSLILVNSPYSQRRGWAIFKKHLPDEIKLYRVNSSTGEPFQKENWYKQENTLRVVLNEFLKMRASVVYNTA